MYRSIRAFGLRAAAAALVLALPAVARPLHGVGAGPLVAAAGTGVPVTEPPAPSAPPDSAGKRGWEDLEEFVPGDGAGWDSVLAAYDSSVRPRGDVTLVPRYGLRYDKAEALHLELGAGLAAPRFRIAGFDLRAGYDTGRERPNGAASLWINLHGNDRWLLELFAGDEVVPFGQHRPYGNSWLALFGGYDAVSYLRQREHGAGVSWRVSEERQAWLGWVRTDQAAVPAVTDWHLFGRSTWMEANDAAGRFRRDGVRLKVRRAPRYHGEAIQEGLVAESRVTAWGGRLLGGSDHAHWHSDVWWMHPARRGDTVQLRLSGTLATGRAPRQSWPDLGGDAGLRAFPPRGAGTPDTLIGHARLYARVEYRTRALHVRRSRIPFLKKLGLKVVPFAELGSVWGRDTAARDDEGRPRLAVRPILELDDLRRPDRRDWRWDLGAGVRRDFDLAGILSHVEFDIAWPMGADHGPPRYTVQFSRDGLD